MRLKYLLDELDLARLAKSKAYTLSGGEKRRLEITRALVTSPKLLLLDEPFSGIDPIAVYEVQKIVRRLKERGLGILITDHNVRETLKLVDRAYLIHKGEVVYEGVGGAVGQRPQSARNLSGPGVQPMKRSLERQIAERPCSSLTPALHAPLLPCNATSSPSNASTPSTPAPSNSTWSPAPAGSSASSASRPSTARAWCCPGSRATSPTSACR